MAPRPKNHIGDHSAKTGGTIRANRKSKIKPPSSKIPQVQPVSVNVTSSPTFDPTSWSSTPTFNPSEAELENAYFIAEFNNYNLSIESVSDIIMEAFGLEDGELMPVVINNQQLNIDINLTLFGGKHNSVRLKKLTGVMLEYLE